MVNVKFKKWLAACIVSMGIVCSAGVTAFAYTGEGTPTEQGTEAPTPIPEQTPAPQEGQTEEGTPFSVPGNGQILDDKNNDSTKQFLTVQTKNGNTFFLVLDRSSSTENVYMLSMVDEMIWQNLFQKRSRRQTPRLWSFRKQRKNRRQKSQRKKQIRQKIRRAHCLQSVYLRQAALEPITILRLQNRKRQKQMPKMKIWNFITVHISMKMQRMQKKQKNRTKQGQLMKGLSFLKRRGTICF